MNGTREIDDSPPTRRDLRPRAGFCVLVLVLVLLQLSCFSGVTVHCRELSCKPLAGPAQAR